MLRNILNRLGFTQIDTITDSRETMARVEAFRPDLIILDLGMPHIGRKGEHMVADLIAVIGTGLKAPHREGMP